MARKVYDIAQPALVNAKEFALCGKYLEPETAYTKISKIYRLNLEYAGRKASAADKRFNDDLAERMFIEDAATLVALLILNDRKPEAAKIADDARHKSKHIKRDAVIAAALEGKFTKIAWSDE